MTGFIRRSLRRQLAALGLAAILVPMVVLLLVVLLTATSSESVEDFTVNGPDTSVEVISEDGEAAVSPWVPATFALLALGAMAAVWLWSGRAVQPLARITAVADEIQQGSLDRRIGLHNAPSEVQSLGDSFDRMLDRLSVASLTQQQLIENANHELRTPLSALAVNAEVILRNPAPSLEDYRTSAERTSALVDRVQTTIDQLLISARSRHRLARQVDNDLVAIVHRVVQQHQVLNPEISIEVAAPPELRLGIDGPTIERAVSNLVENATQHSPAGGVVAVRLSTADEDTTITVEDEGPGINAAEQGHIFERYFRGANAVGQGDGIGLALVKQVGDAYGSIAVESPLGERGGSRFTLTLVAPGDLEAPNERFTDR